jgi:ribose transport system permease protein
MTLNDRSALGRADDQSAMIEPPRSTEEDDSRPGRAGLARARGFARQYLVLLLLPTFVVVFSALSPANFPTAANFQSLLSLNAVLFLLAAGETLVLSAGEFDLSFGGTIGLVGSVTVLAVTHLHVPILVALLLSLGVAIVVGAVNAVFVVLLDVGSFIVTLGMGTLTTGIGLQLTQSQTLVNPSSALTHTTNNEIGGIGLSFFYGLIALLLLAVVFEFTRTGRHLHFVGEGRAAAFFAGVRVDRIRIGALIMSSVAAWLAGLVLLGQTGSVSADEGSPYLLPVFAAVFLGFATIRVGRFNPLGSLVGVLLLAIGTQGLEVLSVPVAVNDIFTGALLMVAVGLANVLGGEGRRRWF